jgi:D-alanine transaminase
MPEIAYVNGVFMPLKEAVVPIEDRGFQFADGIYEVIATYNGVPYAAEAHYKRLERSLDALHIVFDIDAYGLKEKVEEGLKLGDFADTLVYIQITRGVAPRNHPFPQGDVVPTVVMTFKAVKRPAHHLFEQGVDVISTPDLRWKRCDIKSISLLANILAKQEASAAGAYEALLINDSGQVTEGSSTSVFCVKNGVLYTSPVGPHILPSITREVLLDLANHLGIAVRQEWLSLDQYLQADEVFLAGTTTEAMGVVRIDGKQIGDGRPGTICRSLRNAFFKTLE